MTLRIRAVLLLAAAAAAGPEPELLREEAYNYRVVGTLPAGWSRRGQSTVFAYAIDDIPHAHVHFVRERLKGELDMEAQAKKREGHYRFPGAPKDAPVTVRATDWGGRRAVLVEHEAKIQGVICRRRVTVLYAKSIWYELIETLYGDDILDDDACRRGLRVFRRGFRLLTPPLEEGETGPGGTATIRDDDLKFVIVRPAGLTRVDVDPARDPGCRVAFESDLDRLRVRFFEYGTRKQLDDAGWLDIFFTSFATVHQNARREKAEGPLFEGARRVVAERFSGRRDKSEVTTLVYLIHARSGRVYGLRVRTRDNAATEFAGAIDELLGGLRFTE